MNIQQFIEENIELVDSNNFTELYNRGNHNHFGKLTDVLYQSGIDPLQYMTEVPRWFATRSSITSITIPNNVTSISENAFSWCSSLTSVTIGNNVTNIGGRAFCGCANLTSITIPDSVMSIGYRVFEGCGNLQITYSGTTQEWKNLVIWKEIFPEVTYVCTCSDGVLKKLS